MATHMTSDHYNDMTKHIVQDHKKSFENVIYYLLTSPRRLANYHVTVFFLNPKNQFKQTYQKYIICV